MHRLGSNKTRAVNDRFAERQVRRIAAWAAAIACCLIGNGAIAESNSFVDRRQPDDLRVVSYNVLFDTIFPFVNASQAAKFQRVVNALDADVWNFQEITRPASSVVSLLNTIAPLPGGATWHAQQGGNNVIASKYPLSLRASAVPGVAAAIALVDLPNDRFEQDLYVMNSHFTCCTDMEPPNPLDSRERARQMQADGMIRWIRDARSPGGLVTLPERTPIVVAGDFNIVMDPAVYDPLNTHLTGDIFFEAAAGPDFPPDWDGTSLADAHPLHNDRGPEDYTWRNDLEPFDPGRLDYVLYSDSVLRPVHRFVLNTVAMSPAERLATGLLEFDITVDQVGQNYDHLPLVVDFRLVPEPSAVVAAALAVVCLSLRCGRRPR